MKPVNRNKIVRTISRYKGRDGKPDSYEIIFMPFSEFDRRSEYVFADGLKDVELHPYKQFDLRKYYQIPAYWILQSLNKNFTNKIQINKTNHRITSITLLISEISIFLKLIFKLIELK